MTIGARHVRVAFAAALLTCHAAFGQILLTPNHAPFLTADRLRAVAMTEEAAASIVSQGSRHVRTFPNKTTTVIGAQIPENWCHRFQGYAFRRLTDDAARAHLQQCGRLLFVNSFSLVTNELASVAIEEGNRCGGSGLDYRFRRSKDGWQLETDGLHGGFGRRDRATAAARRSLPSWARFAKRIIP